jgi:hypothetical protein
MPTLEEFAQIFPNEYVLQQALARLLSKIPGHTGVQILQGTRELGKDIIFYTPGPFGQKDLNACVIKNTKITGSASAKTGARTVFNQAQQAFDTPLLDENGHEQHVNRVFIITPHPIQPETAISITGALRQSEDRVQFIGGATLLEQFNLYWPEYLSEEFTLIQAYADSLKEAASDAKELQGLSFQYQLGVVDTSIQHIYVPPDFQRLVSCYALCPLVENVPKRLNESDFSEQVAKGIKEQLENTINFLAVFAKCELCDENTSARAREACATLLNEITTSWSLVSGARAAREKGLGRPENSSDRDLLRTDKLAQFLQDVEDLHELIQSAKESVRVLDPLLRSAKTSVDKALRNLQAIIAFASKYVKDGRPDSPDFFPRSREDHLNLLDELARIWGPRYLGKEGERWRTIISQAIDDYSGSVLILRPAGFGKTSFCRWHALNDLGKLLQENSTILPVYVPLHRLALNQAGDFHNLVMRYAGMSALLPTGERPEYDRVRVYLDGLDEVATQEAQRYVVELAQAALDKDVTLQLIVTARDYGYESWMPRLTKLRLSGFDDTKIRELAVKWLGDDRARVSKLIGAVLNTVAQLLF